MTFRNNELFGTLRMLLNLAVNNLFNRNYYLMKQWDVGIRFVFLRYVRSQQQRSHYATISSRHEATAAVV